jgi:3-methyladenine DNA glycosylase AlkD
MESTSELDMAALRRRLEAASAPERAEAMSAYLRNQFPFLGIGAKDRRAATRPTLVAAKAASPDELLAFAVECWEQSEREFAYVACDVLRSQASRLEPPSPRRSSIASHLQVVVGHGRSVGHPHGGQHGADPS